MKSEEIPGRAFIDTSSLNFILEYGEYIFDAVEPLSTFNRRITEDINSFYHLFLTGQRANWQLAVSPSTYIEIKNTKDSTKRFYLDQWFSEVLEYWLQIIELNNDLLSIREAEQLKIELKSNGILNSILDIEDRNLIIDALIYKCDCFCTRDYKTIIKYRKKLTSLPIKIVTPKEWWNLIKPYAGLWV